MIFVRRHRPNTYAAARTLLRSLLGSTALTAIYFVLPLDSKIAGATEVLLLLGLVVTVCLVTYQTHAVLRSPHPFLRAAEALAISFTLFVLVFSATYYLLNKSGPGVFTQPITRLDALYFTVTVFGTVGFGDIAARSEAARAIVTVQIIGDLLFLGLAVRQLAGAAERGAQRGKKQG
jgi:ion channel